MGLKGSIDIQKSHRGTTPDVNDTEIRSAHEAINTLPMSKLSGVTGHQRASVLDAKGGDLLVPWDDLQAAAAKREGKFPMAGTDVNKGNFWSIVSEMIVYLCQRNARSVRRRQGFTIDCHFAMVSPLAPRTRFCEYVLKGHHTGSMMR